MAFMLVGFAIGAADPAIAPATAVSQPSASGLLAQAQSEANAGHNQSAKEILVRAVALYPKDGALEKLLGDVDYRMENYDAAAAAYRAVLAMDRNNKEVHNRLGGVYAAQDKYDDAIAEFRRSLPLSEGFVNLVQLMDDQGRLGDLEAEYFRDLEREPYEPIAHYNLGYIFYYEKKYSQAQGEFETALTQNSRYSDARNALGMTYSALGRGNDAINAYKAVILQDPKYNLAWMNWGVELIERSDYGGAIEKLNHAIDLKPGYAAAYDNLGVANEYLNNFTQAGELYEKALQLDPREREAYQNLGSMYFDHNLLNLAEAAFIKGLAVAPRSAALHFDLGIVYEQQHKYGLAAAQFKAALATAPDNPEMREQLAAVEAKLEHQ